LEIGSYAGSSLLTWSNAAENFLAGECHIVCVDPWGESGADLYNPTMKKNLESDRAYEVFCHNASLSRENVRVTPIRGSSHDILPTFKNNTFDLIYIDGSHQYADVLSDIVESAKLLKNGGIICGDDLELQLFQCDQEFVENNKTADFIKETKSGESFHPGVTLAVAEYFGDVSNFAGFWVMRKISDGFEKVSFSNATGLRPPIWPWEFHERITAYFEDSDELGRLL
jgi:predicted O-methyltransferase YrrM